MRTRPAAIPAAFLLSALLVLTSAGPAAAHGDTIHLQIGNQTDGHLQTVATWENDGDPMTETLAATLSAVSSDGRYVGPWRLVAVPDSTATFTTREALPAGQWKVTVEAGFPALGRAEADVTVTTISDPSPASSQPTTVAPSITAAPAAATTPAAPAAPSPAQAAPPVAASPAHHPSNAIAWISAACAAALLASGAALAATRRRRRR